MSVLVLIFSLRSAGYDVQNYPGAELRRTNRRCIQARYYYVERKSLNRLQGRCKKFHSFLDESHCTAPSFLEGNFTLLQPSETPTDTSDIRSIGQGTPLTIIKITVKIMGIKGMNRPKRISLSFLLFSIS